MIKWSGSEKILHSWLLSFFSKRSPASRSLFFLFSSFLNFWWEWIWSPFSCQETPFYRPPRLSGLWAFQTIWALLGSFGLCQNAWMRVVTWLMRVALGVEGRIEGVEGRKLQWLWCDCISRVAARIAIFQKYATFPDLACFLQNNNKRAAVPQSNAYFK